MVNVKKTIRSFRKERDKQIKLAQEAQKKGRLDLAARHTNQAIQHEVAAKRLERYQYLKTAPLTELPGVHKTAIQKMERMK